MGNTDIVTYQLPVEYNKNENELLIRFPSNLKIRFLDNIDIITEGKFNVLSFNKMNLCSVDNDINIDSINASIYLNSRRSDQIKDVSKLVILNGFDFFTRRKNILNNLLYILEQI